MTQQHYSTKDATSGLAREVLEKFTWPQVASFTGIRMVMVLNDLDTYDIRPEVLAKFKKGARSLTVHLGDIAGEVEFTGEWKPLRAPVASRLNHLRFEDPTLGAPSQEMREINDGYGGKSFAAFTTQGYPDLFEFRMPGEAALVVATS